MSSLSGNVRSVFLDADDVIFDIFILPSNMCRLIRVLSVISIFSASDSNSK